MDVTPLIKKGSKVIQSYQGGKFNVSDVLYKTPIVVSQDCVQEWGSKAIDAKSFSLEDAKELQNMMNGQVEVVLLGVGKTMAFPCKEVRQFFQSCSFSVEVMDTGAACRTYNVLMAEGRKVVAALLLSR